MPRETRPSKFSSPRSSTATRAPRSSGEIRAVYDFQEGTANEGSPVLTGFEDARPGWVRFLTGLGGVQGPDVSGMNAQLALAREGTTAQREMQTEKLRAELEQMRERAKHDLALEDIRNKYRLGQIGAEQAAVLMNNLATNYAQHKGRMAELTAGGEQTRMTQAQKAKLDKENEEFKTYLGWAAKTGANPNDPESMKIYTELQRQVGSTALRRAKSFEGDKQLDDAAKLGELGSLLAPHAKAQKDYTTVVNEKDAAMFGAPAGSGMPRGMLFGATPGTPASLNTPGTPPSPARFEATPDMAAMRAGSTAMPVGRGRAFEDLNMRFVGGEQGVPTVAPRAVDAPPAPAEPYPTVADVGLVGVGSEALRRSGNVGFNFDNPMNPFAPNAPVNPINMLSGIIPGTEVNRAAAESLYKLLYGQKAVNTNSTAMPRLIQLR